MPVEAAAAALTLSGAEKDSPSQTNPYHEPCPSFLADGLRDRQTPPSQGKMCHSTSWQPCAVAWNALIGDSVDVIQLGVLQRPHTGKPRPEQFLVSLHRAGLWVLTVRPGFSAKPHRAAPPTNSELKYVDPVPLASLTLQFGAGQPLQPVSPSHTPSPLLHLRLQSH